MPNDNYNDDCKSECDDCCTTVKVCAPRGKRGCTGPTGPTGHMGYDGETGPTGPMGYDGETGPTGPMGEKGDKGDKGDMGDMGPQGEVGPQGPQGPQGVKGDTGPCCTGATGPQGRDGQEGPIGPVGPQGPQGEKGDTGATGPCCTGATGVQGETGPVGPTGYFATTFLNAINDIPQVVLAEQDITMNKTRIASGNCGHVPGSAKLEVWEAGVYYVTFNIFHTEPLQTALFVNNVEYPDSIIGDQNAGNVCLNSLYVTILPADISEPSSISPTGFSAQLTLRNHTSFSPIGVSIDGHQGSGAHLIQTNVNCNLFLLASL